MKSDVYFVPVAGSGLAQRCQALGRLLKEAASHLSYKKDEIVPIKLTIGDEFCIHHMHPSLVRDVVAAVKQRGARPFLFDTNVIYQALRDDEGASYYILQLIRQQQIELALSVPVYLE